jgi:hypothetical protein
MLTPLVQRQEFRRHELERFYQERLAEPSVRMPDSAGPSTPTGISLASDQSLIGLQTGSHRRKLSAYDPTRLSIYGVGMDQHVESNEGDS